VRASAWRSDGGGAGQEETRGGLLAKQSEAGRECFQGVVALQPCE
jgi:hypothetical protein